MDRHLVSTAQLRSGGRGVGAAGPVARRQLRVAADGVRRAVPSTWKSRLAAALSPVTAGRALLKLFPAGIPAHGARFVLGDAAVPGSVPVLLALHLYEGAEIRMIKRHLRADLDVVELGSSLGITSVVAGMRLGPDRRLICVEANPDLLPVLAGNLERNGLDRCEVLGRAISYDGAEAVFRPGFGSSDGRLAVGDQTDGVRVPTTTLHEVLEQFDVGPYALVCDIEGAELAIVEHDGAALARCRQLLIELHDTVDGDGTAVPAGDIRDRLLSAGFRVGDEHGNVVMFTRPETAVAPSS